MIDTAIEKLIDSCNSVLSELKQIKMKRLDLTGDFSSIEQQRKNAEIELNKLKVKLKEIENEIAGKSETLSNVYLKKENELKEKDEVLNKRARLLAEKEYQLNSRQNYLDSQEKKMINSINKSQLLIKEFAEKKRKLDEILK